MEVLPSRGKLFSSQGKAYIIKKPSYLVEFGKAQRIFLVGYALIPVFISLIFYTTLGIQHKTGRAPVSHGGMQS